MRKDYKYYYLQTNPKEPKAMREVHAIRLMYHDLTKKMSDQALADFYNQAARRTIEKYDLTTVYAKRPT